METIENTQKIEKGLYFTSLGCSKNLVDSEVMLGHLGLGGFKLADNPAQAEVIIVNTCSFIEAAKKESIETILDLADYKEGHCRALVVSGCMAQRYSVDLEKELPEVDLIIGTGEYHKIVPLLRALEEGTLSKKSFVEIPRYIHTEFDPRMVTTPKHMAWLKVSEGCNRNCTFCIIPTLRGKLRSRSVDSLVAEATNLVSQGVSELNIISQDLSDYGVDLSEKDTLYHLIDNLEKVEGLEWVRLFYHYPEDLTEELMAKMASAKNLCKYLDMPVQHISDAILRRMNRKSTGDLIRAKIQRLRDHIPGIVLRTSIIVGFPGETEEQFEELLEFVKEQEFDHLGVFKYSDEEGTPAVKLRDKVSQEVIDERFERLYEVQKEIAHKNSKKFVGKTMKVLVEGLHDETQLIVKARHFGQAPDIDGQVMITDLAGVNVSAGDYVTVKIVDSFEYDLVGEVVSSH